MPCRSCHRSTCLGATVIGLAMALTGCIGDPSRDASYPALLPLEGLLATAETESEATAAAQSEAVDTARRLTALEARASGLQAPVLTPQERARLDAMLSAYPG